jgi:hypothetical protein
MSGNSGYVASSLSQNPNYIVGVSRGSGSLSIQANATAKFSIAIENRWVNILEALGISTDGGGGLASTFVAAAQLADGANLVPTIATSHVWRGSSGIEVTLDMRFDAFNDPVADVLTPVETLLAMFSPVRGGGGIASIVNAGISALIGSGSLAGGNQFLQPPGPTPYSFIQSGGLTGGIDPMSITILIGQTLTIKNMIPTTIRVEMENRFDSSGNPMCMFVQASFISYTVPALNDILALFNNSSVATAINTTLSPNTNTNVAVPTTPAGSGGIGAA